MEFQSNQWMSQMAIVSHCYCLWVDLGDLILGINPIQDETNAAFFVPVLLRKSKCKWKVVLLESRILVK